jgi:small multidrug resistance pump
MTSSVLLVVVAVAVASVAQIFLKRSAASRHDSRLKEYLNVKVVCGYGLLVASTILTIVAYRRMSYKNGPIIESLGYAFVLILSRLFLGERITTRMILGNAIIVVGIVVFYL